jgi:hypothetical protein
MFTVYSLLFTVRLRFLSILLFFSMTATGQLSTIDSFNLFGDVTIAVDVPGTINPKRHTRIILFALPNGNTIAQTMGKKLEPGDDWHYDIQHIRAQTAFLRNTVKKENIIVAYLYNQFKSWPAWKQKHADYKKLIPELIDSIYKRIPARNKSIELSSHSGGGSLIFGLLDGVNEIPSYIKRITFIDSNYGYDSSYAPKFLSWLHRDRKNKLLVFAYNDSVALYNDKPVVSAKGGTWYKSHRMMQDIGKGKLIDRSTDSIAVYETENKDLVFFLKDNPNRGIYHTQQVELNGFIHAALYGTKKENIGYSYWGKRSYSRLIE